MKARALVTGASRGIGRAIAETLAKEGHPVILNYLANEGAALDTKQCIEAAGGRAELSQFDVADPEAVQGAFSRLRIDEHPIGVVVNNAGIVRDAPFPSMTWDDWRAVTRTTLDGFFNVTQPVLMPMVRQRWGRIVNIVSVSGVIGNRGQTNYSAAKAGLIGATRSLSLEVARRGVTVNAVAPGLVETEMLGDAPVDEILKHVPMRRIGKPQEVADLVAFLVSDKAAYITGQVLGINGGLA